MTWSPAKVPGRLKSCRLPCTDLVIITAILLPSAIAFLLTRDWALVRSHINFAVLQSSSLVLADLMILFIAICLSSYFRILTRRRHTNAADVVALIVPGTEVVPLAPAE